MGKFKAPRRKPETPQVRGGLPCVIIVLLAFALVSMLFLAMLRGG